MAKFLRLSFITDASNVLTIDISPFNEQLYALAFYNWIFNVGGS